jgi:hypothetical protein
MTARGWQPFCDAAGVFLLFSFFAGCENSVPIESRDREGAEASLVRDV